MKIKQPNRPTQTIPLGEFTVVSGKLTISDPCYGDNVWCMGTLDAVKNGRWQARVVKTRLDDWGIRVATLVAQHESHDSDIDDLRWQLTDIDVGVDSGQAGIFDSRFYRDDSVAEGQPQADHIHEPGWYSMCCYWTNTDNDAGVIPYGVVASSGCGDGGYLCYARYDGDEVVAVCIDFGLFDEEEEAE